MMNIPFTKFNRPALLFSASMLVIAIGTLFLKGLNLGLDFTGGVSVELKYESKADLEKIRGSLNEIDGANFVVLNFGSDEDVLIKFQSDESLNLNAETVIAKLQEDNYLGEVTKSETIFPQIGEELRDKGGIAILVAIFAILLYIIFRFQIKFGYGAIAAARRSGILLHSATVVRKTAFGFEILGDVKHFSPYQRERIFSVDGACLDKEVCGRSFKTHRRPCSTLLRQRWDQKVK